MLFVSLPWKQFYKHYCISCVINEFAKSKSLMWSQLYDSFSCVSQPKCNGTIYSNCKGNIESYSGSEMSILSRRVSVLCSHVFQELNVSPSLVVCAASWLNYLATGCWNTLHIIAGEPSLISLALWPRCTQLGHAWEVNKWYFVKKYTFALLWHTIFDLLWVLSTSKGIYLLNFHLSWCYFFISVYFLCICS